MLTKRDAKRLAVAHGAFLEYQAHLEHVSVGDQSFARYQIGVRVWARQLLDVQDAVGVELVHPDILLIASKKETPTHV